MFDTTGKIAIAQIAFFLAALLPAQYMLFKHRKYGFLGWLFICLFCIIRIVGAAIIIHDESGNHPISEAGLIISSIAIAPLIISIGGIAHESCGSIEHYRPILFGWIPDIIVHMTTMGAIAILVVGYVKFEGSNLSPSDIKTGIDLVRAGGIILIAIWAMISAIVMTSYLYPRTLRGEKQLAAGLTVALVALIVRILYTVLSSFINTPSFNPRTGGTTAEKVVLDVLPEFILVLALLSTGFASRNLAYEREAAEQQKGRRHRDRSTTPVREV